MIRLTHKVFTDLTIWMIGLGLLIGIVFPFFVAAMGIPAHDVLTPLFVGACMTAGFAVGAMNIYLARAVVGSRLRFLAQRMRMVEDNLLQATSGGDPSWCTPEHCYITVDSDDEIGDSAQAFNDLVRSLSLSRQTESALREFTHTLSSHLEVDPLTAKGLRQIIQHTNAGAGAIEIESDGEVKVVASQGIRSPNDLVRGDHLRVALRSGQRQVVLLPEDVLVEGVLADFRPREVIVDPILYKDVTLGAIILASSAGFTAEERSRLDLFRQGMALALQNALTYDRLQRLAALDALTGAYNRRFGLARLHEEFGRAVRATAPLGVLMLDLDHFKSVNDTYGHLVGDRVLARAASIARSVIREGDIMVRYGGEEFLLVLPAASLHDVVLTAERLRRKVDEASFLDGDQAIHVTVSIGCSAYPEADVDDETGLVKLADKALYTAKEAGRNRVATAASGVAKHGEEGGRG